MNADVATLYRGYAGTPARLLISQSIELRNSPGKVGTVRTGKQCEGIAIARCRKDADQALTNFNRVAVCWPIDIARIPGIPAFHQLAARRSEHCGVCSIEVVADEDRDVFVNVGLQ